MLELFHETNDFYTMKELEKTAPKLKGIVEKTVKDVVESMVGGITYLRIQMELHLPKRLGLPITTGGWMSTNNSVKGADIKQKKRKNQELQSSIESLTQESQNLEEKIKQYSTQLPPEITEKLESVSQQKQEKQMELKDLKAKMKLAMLQKNSKVVKKAANRWTDNIFNLQTYVKKFNMDMKEINKNFGIPDDLDYV
ncbi:hypothetical protein HDV01_003211 [Terramyces sp. JEL0728]|nr:hypothetical protein HDV01_003211 [Terramyces sp. JEL0728]